MPYQKYQTESNKIKQSVHLEVRIEGKNIEMKTILIPSARTSSTTTDILPTTNDLPIQLPKSLLLLSIFESLFPNSFFIVMVSFGGVLTATNGQMTFYELRKFFTEVDKGLLQKVFLLFSLEIHFITH